ncbi:MAG: response regulator [Mucilaginibacter sp.]|nr:response regulator [Mucilaginibacter sp.]
MKAFSAGSYSELPADVKQVSKRALQLGYTAMLTGALISIYYYSIGLYYSAYVDFGFAVLLGVVMILHRIGVIKNLQLYIILSVNLLLIGTSIMEGKGTGQYLYFFPLLVFIPCIVDLRTLKNRDLISYYSVSILSFIIAVIIEAIFEPLEPITAKLYHEIFFTNMCMTFVLTTAFSFTYTYLEYRYNNRIKQEQQNAIASRTRFLSTMGHELRTPLNGIIGAINVLKDEGRINEDDEYLQILKYCSDHMLQQINGILDFNKIEAGKLEIRTVKTNLKTLMDNVTLPFYNHFEQKGIQLKVNVQPELNVNVLADDVRLVQIFNNLLSNALKFTKEGCVIIDVSLKAEIDDRVSVVFSVEDTGVGIAQEDQSRIFEGYWQVYDQNTRYISGTGLGLSICVRLLEMMGSKLFLTSTVDVGSRFSFELNLKKIVEIPVNDKKLSPYSTDNLSSLRILIVEDNMINMMIAKKALSTLQASFTATMNGQEALDTLEKDTAYDLILLDLEMPVLNGYETISILKKRHAHIPVMAFTASLVDQQMLSDLLASGFSDVILKPFQNRQLFDQIKNTLRPELAPAGA